MIMDERTEFANNVTLPTATGENNYGDIYNAEVARNVGSGKPLYCVVEIATAVTSAGSATVAFQVVSDAQDPIQTDGTQSKHGGTSAIPVAQLTAGKRFGFALQQGVDYEQYIGVQAVVGVAALTAGAVNTFLTLDVPEHIVYPEGQN